MGATSDICVTKNAYFFFLNGTICLLRSLMQKDLSAIYVAMMLSFPYQ